MHPELVSVAEDIVLFLHISRYLAFAEVNMSSKVSKETLFESVHAVLQVIKLCSSVFHSRSCLCK